MAKTSVWQDEYWLPVMQIYLKKPVGMKPTYNRDMVELGIELHVAPTVLHARMEQVAQLSTPRLEHFWQLYGENPRRLARAVHLWREMRGFRQANAFYSGVEVAETFERDFRPLDEEPSLTPVALILILDLYFHLTPITMVAETPEVVPQTMVNQTPEVGELARLLKVTPSLVTDVLYLFQLCDPYLNRSEVSLSPLLLPCQQVWQRFEGAKAEQLNQLAEELKEYYR